MRLRLFPRFAAVGMIALAAAGIAVAACPDTEVRPNSPCITVFTPCQWTQGQTQQVCPGNGQQPQTGAFQCDQPAAGKTCMGSGNTANCYLHGPCLITGGNCGPNPNQWAQAVSETKTTVNCPG